MGFCFKYLFVFWAWVKRMVFLKIFVEKGFCTIRFRTLTLKMSEMRII